MQQSVTCCVTKRDKPMWFVTFVTVAPARLKGVTTVTFCDKPCAKPLKCLALADVRLCKTRRMTGGGQTWRVTARNNPRSSHSQILRCAGFFWRMT